MKKVLNASTLCIISSQLWRDYVFLKIVLLDNWLNYEVERSVEMKKILPTAKGVEQYQLAQPAKADIDRQFL